MIQNKEIPNCNFTIENILLGNDSINRKIKLVNSSTENIYLYNLNDYFDNINSIFSPIEIDPLKINNEIFNEENRFDEIFLNTFEIKIKDFIFNENKNIIDLKEKLIDEIPENIKWLIIKYEGIKFNKKMFDDYFSQKLNKNIMNNKNNNSNNNIINDEVEIKIEKTNYKNVKSDNEINTSLKNRKKRKKKLFSKK